MYVGLKLTIPCPAQRDHDQVVLAPLLVATPCDKNVASCLKDEKTLDLDNGRIQGTFPQKLWGLALQFLSQHASAKMATCLQNLFAKSVGAKNAFFWLCPYRRPSRQMASRLQAERLIACTTANPNFCIKNTVVVSFALQNYMQHMMV